MPDKFEDGLFFAGVRNPPKNHPRPTKPAPKTSPQTHIDPSSIPRSPNRTRTESRTLANADFELINRLSHLYTQAKKEKQRHYPRWHRNYRLLHNQFTTPTSSSWAPYPRDSEIYPTISALVAWMTDQNTVIDCTPIADPHSPYYDFISKIAEDLSLVIYSTWQVEDFDSQIKLTLWDTFLYGTGILKNVWDNSLDGGYGNAVIRRVDPYAFYCDPNSTSLADAEFFIEVHRMSKEEVERRFPNSIALLNASSFDGTSDDNRPNFAGGTGSPMDPPNLGALDGKATQWSSGRRTDRKQTLPLITVYEYWIRENNLEEEDYSDLPEEDRPQLAEAHCRDRWRVIVVANNAILLDEYADDLWDGGWHPYERYTFDDIGEFYGISLVDHLAYPQIYLNRLLTALQHNTELTGNPVFVSPTNSGLSRVGVVNKPGQRLDVNPQSLAVGKGPHWVEPPAMPAQVMQLIEFWISRIENTSGLSAIVRGATPTARNSQGVISSIQEAAFVRIRAGLRNLEKALENCIIKVADLISEFYTEPRIIATVGPDGSQLSKVLQSRHFYGPTKKGGAPLKFMINVQAGSSTPTSRQARTAEADTLYAMGALDRQSLLEAHQYPHANEVIKRINAGIADGTFQPPGARQRTQRTS